MKTLFTIFFAVAAMAQMDPKQVEALQQGTGMGMAMPAEMNGYPGPRHLLDLADPLDLTTEQRAKIKAIYEPMHADAVRIGAEILDREKKLNDGFAHGTITADEVRSLTREIAQRQGELRFVHLSAHLAAKSLLSTEQIAKYDALRGHEHHMHPHGGAMQH